MNLGTLIFTALRGRLQGRDATGNRYYLERRARPGRVPRRWVLYAGAPEASAVPPEWHAWLHYLSPTMLPESGRRAWQKPHLPNRTGTPEGYRPPGHDYRGGHRASAAADYQAWSPDDHTLS